jgi:hypothetical protein
MWREKLVQPRHPYPVYECTVPINIELPNIFKRVEAGDIRIVTRLDRPVNSTREAKAIRRRARDAASSFD